MVSNDKKRVNVSFTLEQLRKLDEFSKESGLTRSAVVAIAVTEWLKVREEQKSKEAR